MDYDHIYHFYHFLPLFTTFTTLADLGTGFWPRGSFLGSALAHGGKFLAQFWPMGQVLGTVLAQVAIVKTSTRTTQVESTKGSLLRSSLLGGIPA